MSTHKSVILGHIAPLIATMSNGAQDKKVFADVYDSRDIVNPIASDIPMPHVGSAIYNSNNFLMPNISLVYVQYKIFENDGITPSADTAVKGEDHFQLKIFDNKDELFSIVEGGELFACIEQENELFGILESNDELIGIVED